jgi:hypothetical protein
MTWLKTIHAIRENLQVILSEELTTPRQAVAVKRIDRMLTSLEAQLVCPLEKECPRA